MLVISVKDPFHCWSSLLEPSFCLFLTRFTGGPEVAFLPVYTSQTWPE